MRNQLKFRSIFPVVLSMFLLLVGIQNLYAQNAKKNKIRLKADYVKIMDGDAYLDIKVTTKIKKKNVKVANIALTVYNEFEDEKIKLGTSTTDIKGESIFIIKNVDHIKADSTNTYTLKVSFTGNDAYKKASKRISFKDAEIAAKLISKDSLNYISATLIDKSTDSVITGEALVVQVQRLFSPLRIGKEFNNTDENGTIIVPIQEGIPGVDGNLIIEVVLDDSDTYGTLKTLINAPIGIPIVDESSYDQRTMWSPRDKTPIFILIFTNVFIIGIWGVLLYLITNLFKISKSKI